MVEEIWQELAKARYLEWEQESTMRAWNLQTLKYLLLFLHLFHKLIYMQKLNLLLLGFNAVHLFH